MVFLDIPQSFIMVADFLNYHGFSLLVSSGSVLICTCACWMMAYRVGQAYSQR